MIALNMQHQKTNLNFQISKKGRQQLYTEKFTITKELECMKDRLS